MRKKMVFIDGENENEIVLINNEGKKVGKGYIFESLAPRIFKHDRMDYYITHDVIEKSDIQFRKQIIEKLISLAESRRQKYPQLDARVYHSCSPNNSETLELYKSILDFKPDEGMHELECELINTRPPGSIQGYRVEEDKFDNEKTIQSFLNESSKTFGEFNITIKDIKELQSKYKYKNISVMKDKNIIANIITYVKRVDNDEVGIVDNLFVAEKFRRNKLGQYLLSKAHLYFKELTLDKCQLEVWSANNKAYNLYLKNGYKLVNITDVSVGKSI